MPTAKVLPYFHLVSVQINATCGHTIELAIIICEGSTTRIFYIFFAHTVAYNINCEFVGKRVKKCGKTMMWNDVISESKVLKPHAPLVKTFIKKAMNKEQSTTFKNLPM